MSKREYHLPGPTLLAMLGVVVLPTMLTLATIREPRPLVPIEGNPTPFGYTMSLGFWIIPSIAMALWFLRRKDVEVPDKKAFYTVLVILPAIGCVLDILFATSFFTFVNLEATLGLMIPVVGGEVPVEEFVFYIMGFVVILQAYVWVKVAWLDSRGRHPTPEKGMLQLHWPSLLFCLALVAAGFVYKWYGPHDHREGIPGYFTFLVLAAFTPVVLMFPSVKALVSWRAFSLVMFVTVGVSQIWEASLGVPYQWWGYQPEQMLGIFIPGWTNLPLEASLLWLVVTWATVTWYEAFRVIYAHEGGWREAVMGPQSGD